MASPNVYSRPAGAMETFFKKLGDSGPREGPEHGACLGVFQLEFPDIMSKVRAAQYIAAAWETLGKRYPVLRAEISEPPFPVDKMGRERPIITVRSSTEATFGETSFSTHPGCPSIDALFSTTPHISQSKTATCHWLPDPGQVILRLSHWRTDGLGKLLLAHEFLSTLGSLVQFGHEQGHVDVKTVLTRWRQQQQQTQSSPPMLSPSVEELVRKYLPPPTNPKEASASAADALVRTLVDGPPSIALPTTGGGPNTTSRAAIRLSTRASERLRDSCRASGFTVTCALNAAIIRATLPHIPSKPGAEPGSYALFAPVDLRAPLMAALPSVPEVQTYCSRPTGNYVSGLPLRIGGVAGKSFAVLARELAASYASRDATRGELLHIAEPYADKMADLFATFGGSPGCPYPGTPVITSLGVLDGLIGETYPPPKQQDGRNDTASAAGKPVLRVTDLWNSPECATGILTLSPWSWAGKLTLSAVWNDRFYDRSIATKILHKTMDELEDGLGMPKQRDSYQIIYACSDDATRVNRVPIKPIPKPKTMPVPWLTGTPPGMPLRISSGRRIGLGVAFIAGSFLIASMAMRKSRVSVDRDRSNYDAANILPRIVSTGSLVRKF